MQVRAFGRQLLESVAYLHEVQLVHTDLKPENILLASLEYSKLDPPAATRRAGAARVAVEVTMLYSIARSHPHDRTSLGPQFVGKDLLGWEDAIGTRSRSTRHEGQAAPAVQPALNRKARK